MAKQELSLDDKFDLLISALAQNKGGISKDDLREILDANAKGVQKAMKPENETHPGKSAFSHPDGDVAHPKEALPFQCSVNGYPVYMFPETEHWKDWELYAQLKPGNFTVMRKDGTVMPVEVKGEYDANQKVTKLSVEFRITREEKWLVPSNFVLLYQLVHAGEKSPRQLFLEAMQMQLAQMASEEVIA